MTGSKGKYIILKNAFEGPPTDNNFETVEFDIPELKDGEFLVDVEYLTVDPYMRIPGVQQTGIKMVGEGVGKVTQSKNDKFPVGSLVIGQTGWSTKIVVASGDPSFRVLPSDSPRPSYFLGTLGMPGLTAYLEIEDCAPKEGETFFVNASAGAVGSVVGQLAKVKGCRVVGCAGSDEKVAYLKSIGFDEAFNYKKGDFAENLKAACPNGIDCFVDHVGGSQFDAAFALMNQSGRIVIVGSISKYNATSPSEWKADYIHMPVIAKELTIRGISVFNHYSRFPELFKEVGALIEQGKVKVEEKVYEGFGSMIKAFQSLFTGENIGKIVIKL